MNGNEIANGFLVCAAAALASCGQAQSKGGSGGGGTGHPPYAVVGLSPGMSPDRVEAVMKAADYTKGETTSGRTFEEEVMAAHGQDELGAHHGIRDQDYSKSGGEAVSVTYAAMPGGYLAEHVYYSAIPGVASGQQILDEMRRRYGPRSFASTFDGSSIWCASGSRTCVQVEPSMSISPAGAYPFTSISIQDPTIYQRRAALIRAQPGASKPTF